MLQYVGRMDACVTSLASTQSSRVCLGLRTEVVLKHAHKAAPTLMYGEEWNGHRMLFCSKNLEVSRCKRWEDTVDAILSQVMYKDIVGIEGMATKVHNNVVMQI